MPNALDVDSEGSVGDWRIALAARLSQDVPAAYYGGPAHRKGTPVYQSSLVKTDKGDLVGFTTPSAVALALNIAIRASQEAAQLYAKVSFHDVATPDDRVPIRGVRVVSLGSIGPVLS